MCLDVMLTDHDGDVNTATTSAFKHGTRRREQKKSLLLA
jgi:hypothetical protein